MATVDLHVRATPENFDEAAYLRANPDVADAVARGALSSGRSHFDRFGEAERRMLRFFPDLEPLRRRKLSRLEPFLRTDLPRTTTRGKPDFLSAALRRETQIADTVNVSSNIYNAEVEALIRRHADGLVLDCGAGKRGRYYEHVVNFEIVDYDTTDVVGVGTALPFQDATFDAVLSIAVLEHVRDPFRCAAEIVRVLKPGGTLFCNVPFLSPLHAYPHHYFNMTHQGLRALFEPAMVIHRHEVSETDLPIWGLSWMLRSWAEGLSEPARARFLGLTVKDLMADPHAFLDADFVRGLSEEKNFELATCTTLTASKR